ncbi:lipid-A-disaccharide synthase-related protein [Acaryochloris sp. IP29b_bin.137]|uniref:lipid-A-disaccharide synthase-related protein n=1 Tax=Acaryochloris sp. IP29b_bin.137 TaxID=2969217 RepID=UPI00261D4936|nr:lipid-A-disaccharide synthase-related protein [Acaryochloris sp. IP29b_bin.137]
MKFIQRVPGRNVTLLVISNGHGEDQVAARILQALKQSRPPLSIDALPVVGMGLAYRAQNISLLVKGKNFSSAGFWGRQFGQDLQDGWINLTLQQINAVWQWSQTGGKVLAVGDIVPLMLAWWSGLPYAFVGTAKSEYYHDHHLSRFRSSIYWPWERWLMAHDRCRGVFPRDRITATHLQQWSIPVFDCGNPMMDELDPPGNLPEVPPGCRILLLPGSHAPEVYANWQLMISAITGLSKAQQKYVFLGAIAPGLDLAPFQTTLVKYGWTTAANAPYSYYHQQQQATLWLLPDRFRDCLHAANVVLAMAGTATEQAVGLGKPVITMPGSGPQFTAQFAKTQAQLLGPSIYLIKDPVDLPHMLSAVQEKCSQPQAWIENGYCRMGTPGASKKIAQTLQTGLLDCSNPCSLS